MLLKKIFTSAKRAGNGRKFKKLTIGYTTGVFDLFHIGHLIMFRKNARALCDKLIVGVTVDELVRYKGKESVIPFQERLEIVKYQICNAAIPQYDMDKFGAWRKLNFDIMFVGDDWHNTDKWNKFENQFNEVGVSN